jgi:hypothetical protein
MTLPDHRSPCSARRVLGRSGDVGHALAYALDHRTPLARERAALQRLVGQRRDPPARVERRPVLALALRQLGGAEAQRAAVRRPAESGRPGGVQLREIAAQRLLVEEPFVDPAQR